MIHYGTHLFARPGLLQMISNPDQTLSNLTFFLLQHNKTMQLSIELLDTGSDTNSGHEEAAETEKWSKYVENFVGGGGGDEQAVSSSITKPKEEPNSASAEGVIDPLASSEAALLSLIGSGGINGDVSDELKGHLKKKPVFLSRNIRKWRSRVKRRPDGREVEDRSKETRDKKSDEIAERLGVSLAASSTTTTAALTTTATTTTTASTTKVPTTSTTLTSSSGVNSAATTTTPSRTNNLSDLTVTDDLECKFTLGNFKMLYVVNSESYLYKHSSLQKAKKVRNPAVRGKGLFPTFVYDLRGMLL